MTMITMLKLHTTTMLTANVADDAGHPVPGATVALTLWKPGGVKLLDAVTMTDVGGGLYSYTLASTDVNVLGEWTAEFVTSVSGLQETSRSTLYFQH